MTVIETESLFQIVYYVKRFYRILSSTMYRNYVRCEAFLSAAMELGRLHIRVVGGGVAFNFLTDQAMFSRGVDVLTFSATYKASSTELTLLFLLLALTLKHRASSARMG